jgi:hypothetical protein
LARLSSASATGSGGRLAGLRCAGAAAVVCSDLGKGKAAHLQSGCKCGDTKQLATVHG